MLQRGTVGDRLSCLVVQRSLHLHQSKNIMASHSTFLPTTTDLFLSNSGNLTGSSSIYGCCQCWILLIGVSNRDRVPVTCAPVAAAAWCCMRPSST